MIHFLLHWCLLHADSQLSGDVDKAAALSLSVDELGNFVEDTEETQLSLLEAARLARLDAIREHDARFVRSLANMPPSRYRDSVEDPFTNASVPPDPSANAVDEYESVMSLLNFTRSRCNGAADMPPRKTIPLMQRVKLSVTPLTRPLTIRETAPKRCEVLGPKQHEKGKMVAQEDDGDGIPFSLFSFDSQNTEARLPLNEAGPSMSLDENEADVNAAEDGVQYCQICFEATQTTTTFVKLEGILVFSCFTLLPLRLLLGILSYCITSATESCMSKCLFKRWLWSCDFRVRT